jgi:hypothetical protein
MQKSDDKTGALQQATSDISLSPSGDRVLPYQDRPPKGEPDKRIHPRRPLPVVPDAAPKSTEDKPDASDSASKRPDSSS